MKNTNILITGGSGFIGSNLTRRLVSCGNKPTLLLRESSNLWRINDLINNINIKIVDLLDFSKLKKIIRETNPEVIYHLAAYGAYSIQSEAEKILATNINGTLNLLTICRDFTKIKLFVNTGSSSEYGFKTKSMKEKDILEPNSFYAIAKAAQTHLSNYFAESFNLPIVTLRPFSVYGPYEEPGRLIPNMMKAFYKSSELLMVSKKISRDFIYIDDYINACLDIGGLKTQKGQIFNIGSGKETNMEKLISTFEEVTGRNGKILWNMNKGKTWDTTRWRADMAKSFKTLHFRCKDSLESGLQKNWKWFKTNHKLYDENS